MDLHLNITQDIGHGIMIMFLCFCLVLFSVVIDLFTGVQAAKKCKEKVQKLRKRLQKQ